MKKERENVGHISFYGFHPGGTKQPEWDFLPSFSFGHILGKGSLKIKKIMEFFITVQTPPPSLL